MFNNPTPGGQNLNNSNENGLNSSPASGFPNRPMTSRPMNSQPPRQAEDIFATVDKPAPTNYNPSPTPSSQAQPQNFNEPAPVNPQAGGAFKTFQMPTSANLPNNPLATKPVPASASSSMKYLLIGVLTLIVILAAGLAVYFFVLRPQFQNSQIVGSDETSLEDADTLNQQPLETNIAQPTASVEEITNQDQISTPTVDAQAPLSTPVDVATVTDSDKDGLMDAEEDVLGTDKLSMDTDNDNLNDWDEVKNYKTDPKNPDTDGDTYKDGDEVKNGYNPNGPGRLLIVK